MVEVLLNQPLGADIWRVATDLTHPQRCLAQLRVAEHLDAEPAVRARLEQLLASNTEGDVLGALGVLRFTSIRGDDALLRAASSLVDAGRKPIAAAAALVFCDRAQQGLSLLPQISVLLSHAAETEQLGRICDEALREVDLSGLDEDQLGTVVDACLQAGAQSKSAERLLSTCIASAQFVPRREMMDSPLADQLFLNRTDCTEQLWKGLLNAGVVTEEEVAERIAARFRSSKASVATGGAAAAQSLLRVYGPFPALEPVLLAARKHRRPTVAKLAHQAYVYLQTLREEEADWAPERLAEVLEAVGGRQQHERAMATIRRFMESPTTRTMVEPELTKELLGQHPRKKNIAHFLAHHWLGRGELSKFREHLLESQCSQVRYYALLALSPTRFFEHSERKEHVEPRYSLADEATIQRIAEEHVSPDATLRKQAWLAVVPGLAKVRTQLIQSGEAHPLVLVHEGVGLYSDWPVLEALWGAPRLLPDVLPQLAYGMDCGGRALVLRGTLHAVLALRRDDDDELVRASLTKLLPMLFGVVLESWRTHDASMLACRLLEHAFEVGVDPLEHWEILTEYLDAPEALGALKAALTFPQVKLGLEVAGRLLKLSQADAAAQRSGDQIKRVNAGSKLAAKILTVEASRTEQTQR